MMIQLSFYWSGISLCVTCESEIVSSSERLILWLGLYDWFQKPFTDTDSRDPHKHYWHACNRLLNCGFKRFRSYVLKNKDESYTIVTTNAHETMADHRIEPCWFKRLRFHTFKPKVKESERHSTLEQLMATTEYNSFELKSEFRTAGKKKEKENPPLSYIIRPTAVENRRGNSWITDKYEILFPCGEVWPYVTAGHSRPLCHSRIYFMPQHSIL